jgi:hypothetical protein
MPSVAPDGSVVVRTVRGYTVPAPHRIGDLLMLGWQRGEIALRLGTRTVALGSLVADFEPFTLSIR